MFEKVLLEQNKQWKEKDLETGIQREIIKTLIPYEKQKHIIVITGVRRCGKSYVLRQILSHYLIQKINAKNILFLNLETPYFEEFRKKVINLEKIFEEFLNLTETEGKKILLLDEIQFFYNWQVFAKAKYEEGNTKIVLTGSNAWLLSSEYTSLLSGRTIHFELLPFSFTEFLTAKQIPYKEKIERAENERKIKKSFKEYVQWGGFPEVILTDTEEQKKELLINYYNNIIYRDIIPRFNIVNIRQTQELAHYLMSNPGKCFSYNKLSKIIGLTDKTIKEYCTYFNQAYLLFEINKYSHSLQKQIINAKKVYAIDTAFLQVIGFSATEDSGRIFENLIYIELKRRKKDIYYHYEKRECDFITREGRKITEAIQVCQILTKENREREVLGLYDALETYGLNEGKIITEDQEEIIQEGKWKIQVIPAWKWLIEKEQKKHL